MGPRCNSIGLAVATHVTWPVPLCHSVRRDGAGDGHKQNHVRGHSQWTKREGGHHAEAAPLSQSALKQHLRLGQGVSQGQCVPLRKRMLASKAHSRPTGAFSKGLVPPRWWSLPPPAAEGKWPPGLEAILQLPCLLELAADQPPLEPGTAAGSKRGSAPTLSQACPAASSP